MNESKACFSYAMTMSKSRKTKFSMKLTLSYKTIHIGAIVTFYII